MKYEKKKRQLALFNYNEIEVDLLIVFLDIKSWVSNDVIMV
jgi:hypothetical protein